MSAAAELFRGNEPQFPTMIPLRALSVTMSIFLAAGAVRAGDWPSWGGADPGRNMVSGEKGLPESFKPGEKSTTSPLRAGSSGDSRLPSRDSCDV